MFAESWAIGKAYSYLGDYFDLPFEITPTKSFSYRKKYFAGDRVIIDFPQWVASSGSEDESDPNQISYTVGDCVIVYSDITNLLGGIGYMCSIPNSDTKFDPTKWTQIGNQYDIYYIKYPNTQFVLNIEESNGTFTKGFYKIGDLVCYKNHIYQCLIQTILYSHSFVEQFFSTNGIPPPNYFPDSKNNNQWKDLGEYYFVNEPPFYPVDDFSDGDDKYVGVGSESESGGEPDVVEKVNGCVWELGDNRDPVLIQSLVDLVVWKLHSRISPNNIPELREHNKNYVFQWLRDVRGGEQGIKVPKIQPTQVGDLSWGSNPKKINGYG